ncbi:MAG: hypothetical protein R3Y13_02545 [bacterium]
MKDIKSKIKSTKNVVKTTDKTVKTSIKVIKNTSKNTMQMIQFTKNSIKAMYQAIKLAIKATISSIKLAIASTKVLISAIIAGGWIAIIIIIIVCLIGLICGSTFGIFFSSESKSSYKLSDVVKEINYDFADKIKTIQETNPHDEYIIESKVELQTYSSIKTISEIANINYTIVYKALCKNEIYKLDNLQKYFTYLKSIKEFIFDTRYLGEIKIEINSLEKQLSNEILHLAVLKILNEISSKIYSEDEEYIGTKEFKAIKIADIIKDKMITVIPESWGKGISQGDSSVPDEYKMNLENEEWFVYKDNFGTTEEKKFIKYFKQYIEQMNAKYDKVFVLRNERSLVIYSFEDGRIFEPDFIFFLYKEKENAYEQMQVFIEPKGNHLLEEEKWKEEFLLQLKESAIPTIKFVDDNHYNICGVHFFNQDNRISEFKNDIEELI